MAEALMTTMKSLKLHGMAQAVADLAAQQGPAIKQAESASSPISSRLRSRNATSARSSIS
jgi:hypothetical protein